MNILFIHSVAVAVSESKPLDTPEDMQFGISYISSYLREHGHHTKLIVLSRVSGGKNRIIVDEYLKRFHPKLICFHTISTEYQFIATLAKYIKGRYPRIFLLVGGPHTSLNPNEVIMGDFDALCIGEGEHPVLELVSQLEKGMQLR